MASSDKEDVMKKRETIMADGRRNLIYFTFEEVGEWTAATGADEKKQTGSEDKTDE